MANRHKKKYAKEKKSKKGVAKVVVDIWP